MPCRARVQSDALSAAQLALEASRKAQASAEGRETRGAQQASALQARVQALDGDLAKAVRDAAHQASRARTLERDAAGVRKRVDALDAALLAAKKDAEKVRCVVAVDEKGGEEGREEGREGRVRRGVKNRGRKGSEEQRKDREPKGKCETACLSQGLSREASGRVKVG